MTNKAEIAAVLSEIATQHGGRLTPDLVVKAARDKDSVLHRYFEWRDPHAAHAHRLDQARKLIQSVRVEIIVEQLSYRVPGYVRDPDAEESQQGYVTFRSLQRNEAMARDALAAEFSRALSALRRAWDMADALGLREEIEELTTSIETLKARVVQAPAWASGGSA